MPPTKAQLAKIHIAKKELQLTDEVYRDILYLNFAAGSSQELTEVAAARMLDIMKAKGWKPKKSTSAPGTKKRDGNYIVIKPGPAARQQRKVLAMWNELGYGMDKLHARCLRQFGLDRFEWLSDHDALHVLITDLAKRIKAVKG